MSPELNNIFFECWKKLENGTGRDPALRNMTVCNYAADNINAYTVVLRQADAQTHSLIFYTDHRSPKVEQLKKDAKVTVVLYNDEEKLQLIIKGEAQVHYQNEVTQQHWQKSGCKSRRSYLAQPGPSTVVDEPADGLAYLKGKDFEEHDPAGYEDFAVVTVTVNYLEYLQLNREGNRRAMFQVERSIGKWLGKWLVP